MLDPIFTSSNSPASTILALMGKEGTEIIWSKGEFRLVSTWPWAHGKRMEKVLEKSGKKKWPEIGFGLFGLWLETENSWVNMARYVWNYGYGRLYGKWLVRTWQSTARYVLPGTPVPTRDALDGGGNLVSTSCIHLLCTFKTFHNQN